MKRILSLTGLVLLLFSACSTRQPPSEEVGSISQPSGAEMGMNYPKDPPEDTSIGIGPTREISQGENLEDAPRQGWGAMAAPPAPAASYVSVEIFYGTDRRLRPGAPPRNRFGSEKGALSYGVCKVSIPATHKLGEIERPSWKRLEFTETPSKHVVLMDVRSTEYEDFTRTFRSRLQESKEKEAFVFVHGYSVTFEEAAQRTAQMAYDLQFDGPAAFFSWPSAGKATAYVRDGTAVEWSVPDLTTFLERIRAETGAKKLHLIAHSMGNRALTAALINMNTQKAPKGAAEINQVILTAPDIDAAIFIRDIAPKIKTAASRVILYASSKDKALAMSRKVNGFPRAGDSEGSIVIVDGIETIDATDVDTSLRGHSYYGENRSVISDMHHALRGEPPPRFGLVEVKDKKGTFWRFKR